MATRRHLLWALLVGLVAGVIVGYLAATPRLPTLGATAPVTELTTGVSFLGRIDTGAEITSIHCPAEAIEIADAEEDPRDNVGKVATLRLVGPDGEVGTVTARIEGLLRVRNADHAEDRYQIRLRLGVAGVERETLVTLNDRSAMRLRALLGRDFLRGVFVVDVDRDNDEPR